MRTPEVAPGDGIAVRVIVRGGKKVAIEEVTVRGGEEVLRVRRKGKDWGRSFRVRARDGGVAEQALVVEVPADAVPGTTMALRFEVRSVAAETSGPGGFREVVAIDVVEVDVPVLTAAQRDRKRALGAGAAVAALVAAAIAAALVTPVVARRFRRRERMVRGDAVMAVLVVGAAVLGSLAMLMAAVTYGFVGWFYFARRIVASTAMLETWFPWAMLAVGMTVRRRGRRLVIRDGGDEVVLRVDAGEVSEWTRSPVAALAAARAMVPVIGPREVELGALGSVIVDGTKDRAALANELDAAMRRRVADMMAALAPLRLPPG